MTPIRINIRNVLQTAVTVIIEIVRAPLSEEKFSVPGLPREAWNTTLGMTPALIASSGAA